MLWNVPELDLPKPAELRACQDSGRSQNPPRGPCSLKAKCAVPLFVPLRKPYLKWHETDDFVPWSLGEMSDWGIPHVLGRCSFVIKQQVFFSALQQRGDRFVFFGWWLRTDGVSCLRHWAHKGIKVVWTAQTLCRSWPLWFSYLCISSVSLWSFWWPGFSLQPFGSTRWNMWASKDCMCFHLCLMSVCFLHLSVFTLQASREQTGRGNAGSMDQLLGGTCFSLMCFQGF